jgi:hypothetical protein
LFLINLTEKKQKDKFFMLIIRLLVQPLLYKNPIPVLHVIWAEICPAQPAVAARDLCF